ncbi:hypothetical protein [Halovenus salina]|uniref:Uncharacterized protein n=1 Tax=Halovenus salina TaxID=1510225 RepID=A0ABD5W0V6_9EURY|nr:hypothetical protein [Halovenus salina]
MKKQITHIVPDTQQKINTTVDKDGDTFEVEIRVCPALDDDLQSQLHDSIDHLSHEKVDISSSVYRTNQGNETGQDVTFRFNQEDKLPALKMMREVIRLGRSIYEKQLRRELEEPDGEGINSMLSKQQWDFDDPEVEEFCLLYRGGVVSNDGL